MRTFLIYIFFLNMCGNGNDRVLWHVQHVTTKKSLNISIVLCNHKCNFHHRGQCGNDCGGNDISVDFCETIKDSFTD